MWGYAALLVVVTGSVGAWSHNWGGLPLYEGLMVGLLVGVIVIVAVHQRREHFQTWRELLGIFRRD